MQVPDNSFPSTQVPETSPQKNRRYYLGRKYVEVDREEAKKAKQNPLQQVRKLEEINKINKDTASKYKGKLISGRKRYFVRQNRHLAANRNKLVTELPKELLQHIIKLICYTPQAKKELVPPQQTPLPLPSIFSAPQQTYTSSQQTSAPLPPFTSLVPPPTRTFFQQAPASLPSIFAAPQQTYTSSQQTPAPLPPFTSLVPPPTRTFFQQAPAPIPFIFAAPQQTHTSSQQTPPPLPPFTSPVPQPTRTFIAQDKARLLCRLSRVSKSFHSCVMEDGVFKSVTGHTIEELQNIAKQNYEKSKARYLEQVDYINKNFESCSRVPESECKDAIRIARKALRYKEDINSDFMQDLFSALLGHKRSAPTEVDKLIERFLEQGFNKEIAEKIMSQRRYL